MRDPCLGRSTVRDFTGGIRTRFFHWCEVSEIFTTSVGLAARCGKPENETCLYTARERCAAIANLKKGSLCHRCPACAFVPSDRPRALGHTPQRREPRDPGLPFRLCAGIFQTSLASDNKKPSGAVRSGGSVRCGRSISTMRDRSHEPGVRHRSAQSRSIVGRVFRIRGSSQGSCWFANPMFARAREIRPRVVVVKRQVEFCCNRWRDHPTHVTRVTTLAISSARHASRRGY